jgi:hypothetical protein
MLKTIGCVYHHLIIEECLEYFYGMHPVVYLLVNGISRSLYITTF